ncbi:hypothetical protein BDV25DRAFT_169771 [Aspergillus avenaceus]|uniref:NAD-dependent epimerase/dehydratase domain-containing protein n=1 Tax=Aspergillus avenaceus TaxID=36643 RepID=A0A5N6TJS3_ASPAV|nr:hypothetical protein BDV25DRAFT_169771 [Aspergillus avenaceus]
MAPTIFGLGTGPFNRYSIQLPALIADALKSGSCGVIGDGKTRWSHIHILDLATLHTTILRKICTNIPIASGRKGIYFCESGEHTHFEFSRRLAEAGYELGLLKSADVKETNLQIAGDKWAFGSAKRAELAFASNARTKAGLGRKLGWAPLHGHEWENTFKVELSEIRNNPPGEREIPQVLLNKN